MLNGKSRIVSPLRGVPFVELIVGRVVGECRRFGHFARLVILVNIAAACTLAGCSRQYHPTYNTAANPQRTASTRDWQKTLGMKLPPLRVESNHLIVGSWGGLDWWPALDQPGDVQYKLTSLQIGDADCDPVDIGGNFQDMPDRAIHFESNGDRELPTIQLPVADAPGGPQTVTGTFEVRVETQSGVTTFIGNGRSQINLPPGMAVVGRVVDTGLEKAIRSAIQQPQLEFRGNGAIADLRFKIVAPPKNLAMAVELVAGDEPHGRVLGTFVALAGATTEIDLKQKRYGFDRTEYTVRLRPDLAVAARARLLRVWGKTVDLSNVPTTWLHDDAGSEKLP